MAKFSVEREMRRAEACERKGAMNEAKRIYETIVEKYPNNARARNALSASENRARVQQAPSVSQDQRRGLLALYRNGNFAEAADQAAILAEQDPSLLVYNILGAANYRLGRFEAAELGFRKSADLDPASPEARHNLGNVLNDLGNALFDDGRLEEAIDRFLEALRIMPDFAQAHSNLGNALRAQNRLDAAIASYERALKIEPALAEVHNNLGAALFAHGQLARAVASYDQALAINPDLASAHSNRGVALVNQGRLSEAVASFGKALEISPGNSHALAQKLHQQAQMCDWTAGRQFDEVKASLGIVGGAVPPFALLAREDHPERQLQRAQAYARHTCSRPRFPFPARHAKRAGKLRIGYFSAHFHDHATMFLISGLLREHDRSRFEIYAYGYGATRTGRMRDDLIENVDHFVDVSTLPDQDVVDLARNHGIDIAIDLMGYTQDTRSRLFGHGLAPIQVSYLVYPGTMGADFIDYIIADPIVVPPAERQFYSEKVILLPDSYQPNDNRREITLTTTTRADFGLLADGFVFCCFNNSYKITPREFDIWMRLLGKVDGSVLWLLRANEWSEANLREEARRRGIHPDRLVFAERLEHGEHLARHKHADLFVDTFNYNAHTTASDALWSTLPVVTKAGRQFTARVAASLLHAVGLPELVTNTEADYEALILDLATTPGKLAATKAKLARNRLTEPLFDTTRYARHFEQALEGIFYEH